MMKNLLIAGIVLAPILVAIEKTPDLLIPGGAWYRAKSSAQLTEKVVLTGPAQLEADEIIVSAPIVTNGHRLDLHTRKLIFKEGGKIVSFETSAATGISGPAFPGPAPTPNPRGRNGSVPALGETGPNGADGKIGNPGIDGLGADLRVLPGEVHIFSAQVEGEPEIEGFGQAGGQGGRGGKGQSGASGGQGRSAAAKDPCWVFGDDWDAGPGGSGGKFGLGGKGAAGGKGGAPVPVSFLLAWDKSDTLRFPKISSRPGIGGLGGIAGEPGDAGPGGPGGHGDSNTCWFFFDSITNDKHPGASGAPGQACFKSAANPNGLCAQDDKACALRDCTLGDGAAGVSGDLVETKILEEKLKRSQLVRLRVFKEFEKQRHALSVAWYGFHWSRYFETLVKQSLYLLDDMKLSADENQGLTSLEEIQLVQQSIAQVASLWRRHFLKPLQTEKQKYADQVEIVSKFEWAEARAMQFIGALEKIGSAAKLPAAARAEIDSLLKFTSQRREEDLKTATHTCGLYIKNVLQNPEFKQDLEFSQYHFDVPACTEASLFLGKGVMRPIELVADVAVVATGVFADKLRAGDQAGKTTLLKKLWDLLIPSAYAVAFEVRLLEARKVEPQDLIQALPSPDEAARLGRLGLLKGYQIPNGNEMQLEDLIAALRAIVKGVAL